MARRIISSTTWPGPRRIVDLFHARQLLWDLARLLHPNDIQRRDQWVGRHQKRWLDKGEIAKLVASLRFLPVSDAEPAKKIRNEADYFANNAACMNSSISPVSTSPSLVELGQVDRAAAVVEGRRVA